MEQCTTLESCGRAWGLNRSWNSNAADYNGNVLNSPFVPRMKEMRVVSYLALILVLGTSPSAHAESPAEKFSITLQRIGCLGFCPDYKVTIFGNGSVRYEGRMYVREKGVRENTIPVSTVQRLIRKLRDEDVFNWKEETVVCVDYPEVHIRIMLDGKSKHVLEGCKTPGKVLKLADEIDRISGTSIWRENLRR
jgi:hypothetical protein